jgi:hypothetical protein
MILPVERFVTRFIAGETRGSQSWGQNVLRGLATAREILGFYFCATKT